MLLKSNNRQELHITDKTLHNAFQCLTWDASADAKAFRATADLPAGQILDSLDHALRLAVEPAKTKKDGGVFILSILCERSLRTNHGQAEGCVMLAAALVS